MQSPIPESRAADAAWLSAQVAEFERTGGQVEKTPIRKGDPKKPAPNSWRAYRSTDEGPRNRKPAPEPGISAAQKLYMAQCEDKRKQITPAIIEMSAEGVKVDIQAKKLGVSPGLVLRIRGEQGLTVKRKPRINTVKELADKHCKPSGHITR